MFSWLYPLTVQARSPGLSSLARLQGETALSQVTTLCHTAAGQWEFVFVFVVISTHGSSTLSWAKLTGYKERQQYLKLRHSVTLLQVSGSLYLFSWLYPLTVQARSPGLSSLARLQGETALSQVTTLCHTAAGQWEFVFVFVVISTQGSSTHSWAKLTGAATRNDSAISSYDTLSHCCRSVGVCICFRGYIHSGFKHALLG